MLITLQIDTCFTFNFTTPLTLRNCSVFHSYFLHNCVYVQLSLKLSVDELRRFAQILKMWWNAGLPFDDFCNNLLELYGPERKYLLSGLLVIHKR
jgi:hypothetical protein